MRRIRGLLHHRWRMALFGAIQLPSRGTISKQGRSTVRDAHAHSCWISKEGKGREGGWGEMFPRLGVGSCRDQHPHIGFPISIFSNPPPHHNNTEPSRRRRHPTDTHHGGAFPGPFRSGWPELTSVINPPVHAGDPPPQTQWLGHGAEDEMPLPHVGRNAQ